MNIVVITTSFTTREDGSEAAGSFVLDFVKQLSATSSVTVLAPGREGTTFSISPNLQVTEFSAPIQPLSTLKPANPRHWLPLLTTLGSGRRSILALVEAQQVDHVLALWALPSGYWAWLAWKKWSVPYSVWALGSDIWSLAKLPVAAQLLARVLQHSRNNFADGQQLCLDVGKISGRECSFLPSTRNLPVPQTKPVNTHKGRHLAFLGRWHPNKGADLLLEALQQLPDAAWEKIAEIRFHGGGPLQQQIAQLAHPLHEKSRPLTIGGYLGRNEAAELLSWADYVIIPSRIESIPVIFSDAMKMQTPVLAMPVGDLPALVAKYNCGLVANQPTAEALCNTIEQALDLPVGHFTAGTKLAATEFDIATITSKYLGTLS